MSTKRICSIQGCEKPARRRGWCDLHYARWLRNGDPNVASLPNRPRRPGACSIDGCEREYFTNGYCSMHYTRWRRHGDPHKKTKAAPGECLEWLMDHIDYDGDDCLEWPFARHDSGYGVASRPGGRSVIASRLMCELAHGAPPQENYDCAHNCGKGHLGCVNPRHLRWDTRKGNLADRIAHGTDQRGERGSAAKITTEQAIEILQGTESLSKTARRYGIKPATVSAIRRRKIWAHLHVRPDDKRAPENP